MTFTDLDGEDYEATLHVLTAVGRIARMDALPPLDRLKAVEHVAELVAGADPFRALRWANRVLAGELPDFYRDDMGGER